MKQLNDFLKKKLNILKNDKYTQTDVEIISELTLKKDQSMQTEESNFIVPEGVSRFQQIEESKQIVEEQKKSSSSNESEHIIQRSNL